MTTIYSAQVFAGRRLCETQVIEFEGEYLLVVQWFGNPSLGLRRPEYVIPLGSLEHQDHGNDQATPCRFFVNEPLPESLFDMTATPAECARYGVRRGPDVTYPMETKH